MEETKVDCSILNAKEVLLGSVIKASALTTRTVEDFDNFNLIQSFTKKRKETVAFLSIILVCILVGMLLVRLICLPISLVSKLIKGTPNKLMFVYGNSFAYGLIGLMFAYLTYSGYLNTRFNIPNSFVKFVYQAYCILNCFLPTYLPEIFKNMLFVPISGFLYPNALIPYRALLSGVRGLSSFVISLGGCRIFRTFSFTCESIIFGYTIYIFTKMFKGLTQIELLATMIGFLIEGIVFGIELRNIIKAWKCKKEEQEQEEIDGVHGVDPDCLSSGSEPTDTGDVVVAPVIGTRRK